MSKSYERMRLMYWDWSTSRTLASIPSRLISATRFSSSASDPATADSEEFDGLASMAIDGGGKTRIHPSGGNLDYCALTRDGELVVA